MRRKQRGFLINPFAGFGGGGGGDPSFSSVKLLLPFDGANGATTTTDLSSSPATVSMLSGASLSTTRFKYGTASALFDGVNDSVTTNRATTIGAGAFTLEAHVRPTGAQTGRIISSQSSVTPNAVIAFRVDSTGAITALMRNVDSSGLLVLTSATGLVAMNDTAWYHVAVTRGAANRIDIWLDGVSVANGTSAVVASSNSYVAGSFDSNQEFFKGYIDNVRVTEVCRYTGTFTPPTAAYPTS